MDKVKIEIEKLRQEINEIEKKINKNEVIKNNLSRRNDFLINEIRGLNIEIQSLYDIKEQYKDINKCIKINLFFLILSALLLLLMTIGTISAIYVDGFDGLKFLFPFVTSVLSSYFCGDDYVNSKKEKKRLDAQDIDIKLNTTNDKLKKDTLMLDRNKKHDEKIIEELNLENFNLEESKKAKEKRIKELSILRNNIIKSFIENNVSFDDIANMEYEKSIQKVKKINSDK